jgi:uncharacterized protein
MLPLVKKVADEYKQSLKVVYGNELMELILFGSYARGNYHDESDLDFAIVFSNSNIRPSSEILRIAPISSRLSLKHGIMISSLPVSKHKKDNSMQGVYQEIRREGIQI